MRRIAADERRCARSQSAGRPSTCVQRLPARLATTPQTVHGFTPELWMGWLARSIRSRCHACWATGGPAMTRGVAELLGHHRRGRTARAAALGGSDHGVRSLAARAIDDREGPAWAPEVPE